MLNYKSLSFLFALVVLLLLESCGTSRSGFSNGLIQKRRYSSGWHLNLLERNKQHKTQNEYSDVLASMNLEPEELIDSDTLEGIDQIESVQNYWTKSSCELIVRTDGVVYEVDSIRIENDSIYFQSCERPEVRKGSLPMKRVAGTRDETGCVTEYRSLDPYLFDYGPDRISSFRTLKKKHPLTKVSNRLFWGHFFFTWFGGVLGILGFAGIILYLVLTIALSILTISAAAKAINATSAEDCRYRFTVASWLVLALEVLFLVGILILLTAILLLF